MINYLITIMIKHIKTGLTFKNRKEAKQVMGQGRFKRLSAKGEFEFINEDKD